MKLRVEDCPQLRAVLVGGPFDGTRVPVPMLPSGKVPDRLHFAAGVVGTPDDERPTLIYTLAEQPGGPNDIRYAFQERREAGAGG